MIPHPNDTSDERSAEIGAALVKVLQLKPDPDYDYRWQTTAGSKTSIGIYRTVVGILENPERYSE